MCRRTCLLLWVLWAGCAPALVWEGRAGLGPARVKIVEDRKGQRVVVGDREGHRYKGIGVEELTFSPDGKHLAYPARVGDAWTVVLDDRELSRWSAVGELRFSRDGTHLAFSAEREGRWYVVADEKTGPPVDAIFARTLRWGSHGRAIACVADRKGQSHVVLNQVLGPAFDGIGRLLLGAREGRLLYAGRRADGWHVVDGDKVGPAFAAIVDLAMSPNEQHIAFVWRDDANEGLVIDGEDAPPYRSGNVSSLLVDDDRRLTFVATSQGQARVVRRGVVGPIFEQVSKLVVTRAGRFAYVGLAGQSVYALIDGDVAFTADAIEDVSPSPDGRHFVFLLRRGERWFVADENRDFPFDRVIAGSLAWSRDSRHWGALAGDAKTREIFISVNGRARRPFDMRELVLAAEKRPGQSPEEAAQALQALVAAELDAAEQHP